MTYSRAGLKVTVEFSLKEYTELLAILGLALIAAECDSTMLRDVAHFIKELNRTNPDFEKYKQMYFENYNLTTDKKSGKN